MAQSCASSAAGPVPITPELPLPTNHASQPFRLGHIGVVGWSCGCGGGRAGGLGGDGVYDFPGPVVHGNVLVLVRCRHGCWVSDWFRRVPSPEPPVATELPSRIELFVLVGRDRSRAIVCCVAGDQESLMPWPRFNAARRMTCACK